jgi:hypothetical protein
MRSGIPTSCSQKITLSFATNCVDTISTIPLRRKIVVVVLIVERIAVGLVAGDRAQATVNSRIPNGKGSIFFLLLIH